MRDTQPAVPLLRSGQSSDDGTGECVDHGHDVTPVLEDRSATAVVGNGQSEQAGPSADDTRSKGIPEPLELRKTQLAEFAFDGSHPKMAARRVESQAADEAAVETSQLSEHPTGGGISNDQLTAADSFPPA